MATDAKHDFRIDNLRAFAILTVVFGHSIILYSTSWGVYQPGQASTILDYVKRVINLYQMPLFFSLSGFLFAKSFDPSSPMRFFLKKAKRILLPFLIVGIIWMIPIKLAAHYPGYNGCSFFKAAAMLLIGTDTGHLWYLPTLFLFFIIAYIIALLFKNKLSTWLAVTVAGWAVSCLRGYFPAKIFITDYLRYIAEFFWSFPLGCVIFHVGKQNRLAAEGKHKKLLFSCLTAAGCIASVIAAVFVSNRFAVLSSVLIIITLYLIVPGWECSAANALSKNSFGLYLFHSPLIYITFCFALNYRPVFVVLINFLIWGGAAYLLTSILRKTQLKLIIGE